MQNNIDRSQLNEQALRIKAQLLASLLLFTRFFYKERTGRDFEVSEPVGRESHHITICRELTSLFYLENNRLIINIEPGSGKSELCRHFIAWCFAHYADCNFIYVSVKHELAAKSTAIVKDIISMPIYRRLFGVHIDPSQSAKDNFKTTAGGAVYAAGADGGIVGFDAGLPISDRFSGCYIMDDMCNPHEVSSDTSRQRVKNHFLTTGSQRTRSEQVPFLFIGQRVHEDDLPASLINGMDGHKWKAVILKSIDEAGNVLNPKTHSKENLLTLKATNPYVFSSQFQQEPVPAGDALFKEEWFVLTDDEPSILAAFITADTAETVKSYNDATAFSFWGLYKIKQNGVETNLYGLHWINNIEIRVEPAYLESEFMSFYANCMMYPVKPFLAAIEKKSTGVTLSSVLSKIQGLQIIQIERSAASGNKGDRFISIQSQIASKLISLPKDGKHTRRCIEHMIKITANESHRWDDTADTLYDAVKIALIDKLVQYQVVNSSSFEEEAVLDYFNKKINTYNKIQRERKW